MELQDIQGILIRGHGEMSAAAYLLLAIEEPINARLWLKRMLKDITNGNTKPKDKRVQIAFSHEGLAKLGTKEAVSQGFSVEFTQGMATEYRARILGDLGTSGEAHWNWGGSKNEPIDICLMIYAPSESALQNYIGELREGFEASGLRQISMLNSESNPSAKEHFGFRDGIAQPIIEGLNRKGIPENQVPTGEFILGHSNAYSQLPETPLVPLSFDPENHLETFAEDENLKDFGKNGSYMVFRQLKQDVTDFWKMVHHSVKRENPDAGVEECIELASKMVGRWPNGTPITLSPEGEKPELAKENNFLYAENDPKGFGCPLGSHIRRANPRDTMPDNKPEKSVKISNRHRILRRGRNFGPPLVESLNPADLIQAEDDGQERGLHFICFNTNISRQFEFIQHSWSNNTKFAGLYNDPDPILGIKDTRNKKAVHDFTIEADPVRRKIHGMSRQVHVLGGAYLFLPSMRALRFLAHYQPQKS